MKELIFADGRKTEVQSVSVSGGTMHVKLILTTSEQLKAFFADTFATSRMTLRENYTDAKTYENYTDLKWIKEETGGIWEVEILQTEADPATRISSLETATEQLQKEQEGAQIAMSDLQLNMDMAVAELTLAIAAMMPSEGGVENV